jgi:hypothetical protein
LTPAPQQCHFSTHKAIRHISPQRLRIQEYFHLILSPHHNQ